MRAPRGLRAQAAVLVVACVAFSLFVHVERQSTEQELDAQRRANERLGQALAELRAARARRPARGIDSLS